MYTCSPHSRIEFMNSEMAEWIGRNVIGEKISESVPELTFTCPEEAIEEARQGKTVKWDALNPANDRWYRVVNAPHENPDGSVSVLVMVRDITEQKSTEERVRLLNNFLDHVVESLAHPFLIIDPDDYSIVMANSAAKKAGAASGFCAEMGDDDFNNDNLPCPLDEINRTGKPVIKSFERELAGNSKYLEIHAHPFFDKDGNLVKIVEYILDLTEKITLEQALRDSETRTRSVAQSSVDAIISSNDEDVVIFWNDGARKMFGYREEEILGKPVTTIIPERYRKYHSEGVKRFLETGATSLTGRTMELQGLRKNGQEFPLELSLSTWRARGRVYFSGIIRDITDRKEAEQALAQRTAEVQERKEELEALIQMVAHDLKSPVIAIAGLVRSLKKKIDSNPQDENVGRIAEQILTSSQTMEEFLTDLLDAMAVEKTEPQLEQFNLEEVIEEVVSEHRPSIDEKRITVQTEFFASDSTVTADKRRIKQVFDNLVSNAWRYMGDVLEPTICIKIRDDGLFVTAMVCDNGIGIPQEYQKRVFDQFFRVSNSSQQKGTGLGLSIVKKIVEIHGGAIHCESELGKGAAFIMKLPRNPLQ
ncbi:PAS domain S-box protein [Desulfomonile tiedjei]|uniref:PAS domain S-box protein n=1 Tax=Desulfomonile tiedjei TaxID=2358 RepID=UPI0023519BBA|nr:PAS domain S-box protein [Desulfomonile tiedjei]